MKTLLVIDDEESVRYSFRSIFSLEKMLVLTAASAQEGVALLVENDPDVVVLDLQLPDRSGMDVFEEIHRTTPKTVVIFITAHGTTELAIEAMKRGAFDYLVKPLDLEHLSHVIERGFDAARLMDAPSALPADDVGERIVGHSAVMQEMCKMIGRIAPQDVNVLITGESGTGKELVARALYAHSRRSAQAFLAVDCAAIPEHLLESELFGHEAGAYTGAARRRIGKFEQCSGGTLFLDEIGDMPALLQAKILRILQEQRFERIGGNETIATDVRVLAATNQDLPGLIAEGRFRKDLYYRLNAVTIRVPPLRIRLEDVAELAHYFLFRLNRELRKDLRGFAPEVLDLFANHAWPGNVRELQGVSKQAMINASGHLIVPEFLPDSFHQPQQPHLPEADPDKLSAFIDELLRSGANELHSKVVGAVERMLFFKVLEHTHGNHGKACELLGLNRATLRQRLRAFGLAVDKVPIDATDKSHDPK